MTRRTCSALTSSDVDIFCEDETLPNPIPKPQEEISSRVCQLKKIPGSECVRCDDLESTFNEPEFILSCVLGISPASKICLVISNLHYIYIHVLSSC